jgi:hypothetical protein
MSRATIICVLLAALSWAAAARAAPDLSSLAFVVGPSSTNVPALAENAADTSPPSDLQPQRPNREQLAALADRLLQSIDEEKSRNGERSSNLIDPLTSLAAVYDELGDHLHAVAALEQARALIRMTNGLRSLKQAAIVEQQIDAVETIGSPAESAALQESLLELAQDNAGNPGVAPLLTTVADRQMNLVRTYLEHGIWPGTRDPVREVRGSGWKPSTPIAMRNTSTARLERIRSDYDETIHRALKRDDELENLPAIEAGLTETYRLIDTVNDFVEEGPLPRGFPPQWDADPPSNDREFALAAFRRARRLYSAAMQAARANSPSEAGEHLALERQLIATYYFEAAHPELHPREHVRARRSDVKDKVFLSGVAALQAEVIDNLTRHASPTAVARALVELGDWRLIFSDNGTALKNYQDAYDFLVRKNVPAAAMASLFSPALPAMLPAFAQEMHFDPARRYRGYIDVAVEIGRYGGMNGMDIVAASPHASGAIQKRLKSYVAENRFRPRFVDGRPLRSDRFPVRFYFDFSASVP